jgi:hypothetical protein
VVPAGNHDTAEAWPNVTKTRDRFAALRLIYDAMIDRSGGLAAEVAVGPRSVTTGGRDTPQATSSARSAGSASADDAVFLGEPETGGCGALDPNLEDAVPVG